jgi:hypothetical protein
MLEAPARDQHASPALLYWAKSFDYCLVCIAFLALVVDDAFAGEPGRRLGESTVFIDRVGDGWIYIALYELASIGGPDFEVVPTMSRRSMHEASAILVGDVITRKKRNFKFVTSNFAAQWMSTSNVVIGRKAGHSLVGAFFYSRSFENSRRQLVSDHKLVTNFRPIILFCFSDSINAVLDFRRV